MIAIDQNDTPVAFFDFDGTLTEGDTLLPFLRYLAGRLRFHAGLVWLSPVLVAYAIGLLRNDRAKEIVLRHFISGYSLDELHLAGRQFGMQVLPQMLRPSVMSRLAWHRNQGHDCVLVSASLDLYLHHWASKHGLVAVLCSSLVAKDGCVTGALFGRNCFGEEKVTRMRAWLGERRPARTYAYGDTRGDHPMLGAVDEGYLVVRDRLERFNGKR